MSLRFLERELGKVLAKQGREDLMGTAVGSVGLTDDGETLYVHLIPKKGWPGVAQGKAFVLAWEDYVPEGSQRMFCYRWLMGEAKRSMGENGDRIVRWLEGK
jgi:hypothetical protein